MRRRRRHIERTVQFASFGAQCTNKPLSLLGKSETAFSLSKGKRRNGVDRPSPPQRRNTPAHNVRSRHWQVLETSRQRSRHVERTVQFASIGAQCPNKPLSLLGKSETAFSLSKGKRKGGVRSFPLAAGARNALLREAQALPFGKKSFLPKERADTSPLFP